MSAIVSRYLVNKEGLIFKSAVLVLIASFIGSSLILPQAMATGLAWPSMPAPGVMVNLSPEYTPAYLKGIVIHPENALKFDFIIYKGDQLLNATQKKAEYTRLMKYFLVSLAVPDNDQWVNLSPYEKNRIIMSDFGKTQMGRDLLTQDYLLKQITSSLIYPESNLGRKFWDTVYSRAYKEFGSTQVPVNTFNKVWIVPDNAVIYEKGNMAYVIKNHLKVMLEEDYLSLKEHSGIRTTRGHVPEGAVSPSRLPSGSGLDVKATQGVNLMHNVGSQIIKAIVLPELEKEVNNDKNFAPLRQIYSGMILAAWYKRELKASLLAQVYANKNKVKGEDQNPRNNLFIYHQYIKAFKKGVFNFIREDVDKYTNEVIPRKYFSGGTIGYPNFSKVVHREAAMTVPEQLTEAGIVDKEDMAVVALGESGVQPIQRSRAMTSIGYLTPNEIEDLLKRNESEKIPVYSEIAGEIGGTTYYQSKSVDEVREEIKNGKINVIRVNGIVQFVLAEAIPKEGIIYFNKQDAYSPEAKKIDEKVFSPSRWVVSMNATSSYADLTSMSYMNQHVLVNKTEWAEAGSTVSTLNPKIKPAKPITAKEMERRLIGMGVPSYEQRQRGVLAFSVTPFSLKKPSQYFRLDIYISPYSKVPRVHQEKVAFFHLYVDLLPHQLEEFLSSYRKSPDSILRSLAISADNKLRDIYNGLKDTMNFPDHEGLYGPIYVGEAMAEHKLFPVVPESVKQAISADRAMARSAEPQKDYTQMYVSQALFDYFPTKNAEVWTKVLQNAGARKIGDVYTLFVGMSTLKMAEKLSEMSGVSIEHPVAPNADGRKSQTLDSAMTKGGIDLNAANLAMIIKRDGRGIPLPVSQQDLQHLHITGLFPIILSIRPATSSAVIAKYILNLV